jgi:uncharacterized cupredoxin-like copper-binding protein
MNRALRLPLLALAGLAATAAVAGCGNNSSSDNASAASRTTAAPSTTPAPTSASSKSVAVDLSEWSIKPSASTAKAGPVAFAVHNAGSMVHEMVVLKTSKAAAGLGNKPKISEATSVGEAADIAGGATKRVTIDLKPGHYVLVCNLPGHYMQGMRADLTVQ